MRKIFTLFCLCGLLGCSKTKVTPSTSSLTTVTYKFAANTNGTYSLTYFTPLSSAPVSLSFTGTTWSKTDTINTSSYSNGYGIPLYIDAVGAAGESYNVSIAVNSKIEASGASSSNTPEAVANYSYVVSH
jgi:hypothetical protein